MTVPYIPAAGRPDSCNRNASGVPGILSPAAFNAAVDALKGAV
jgi:hypothetical protein